MPIKTTTAIRKILIICLVISFAILIGTFFFQYNQYKKVENRLTNAYASVTLKAPRLYQLFSVFSEADNLFRLYTLNYSPQEFKNYRSKLDTLKLVIDSVRNESFLKRANTVEVDLVIDSAAALEFAQLRRQVDEIILFAQDTLQPLNERQTLSITAPTVIKSDSIINRILNDTLHQKMLHQDTIVVKKKRLIQRIFNNKNDTLVYNNSDAILNINQIDLVQRHIDRLVTTNDKIYRRNLDGLKNSFELLRIKERKLIDANFSLLENLKSRIENLERNELNKIREAEQQDFSLYKKNTRIFKNQLLLSLGIIFIMIMFLVYYQRTVARYEQSLEQERDYASRIAEEKSSILANISHEVRTPLNSLIGVIDRLKGVGRTNGLDRNLIDEVLYDTHVINNTVVDILNLSKLETQGQEIDLEYICPHRIIEDIIMLHQYPLNVKALHFINENQIDPSLMINSNAFCFKQIVSNLLSNAIKYTRQGTIRLSSRLMEKDGVTTIIVKVSDTGMGIPREKLGLVFRKYYVVDPKNKAKGFGLGLHISQVLANLLKGNISVKSTVDKGSVFKFECPAEVAEVVHQEPRAKNIPRETRIVIIDDNKINLFLIEQFLSGLPHVRLFDSSLEGLNYIMNNEVDIVITDIEMPDFDGWKLLEEIKNTPHLAHIKVLAATAELELLKTRRNQVQNDFDAVLQKPLSEDGLVDNIVKASNAD